MEYTTDIGKNNLKYQLSRGKGDIPQLFEKVHKKIKSLNENIYRKINIQNVVYKIDKNFAEIKIQAIYIRIVLRAIEYRDIVGVKVEEIPATHKWGKKIKIYIENKNELDIVMPLIKRSYDSSL